MLGPGLGWALGCRWGMWVLGDPGRNGPCTPFPGTLSNCKAIHGRQTASLEGKEVINCVLKTQNHGSVRWACCYADCLTALEEHDKQNLGSASQQVLGRWWHPPVLHLRKKMKKPGGSFFLKSLGCFISTVRWWRMKVTPLSCLLSAFSWVGLRSSLRN